jgi:hypothetical protein
MREIWARRIAATTGIIVVVLAVMFARSQNPPQVAVSETDTAQPGATDYADSRACAKCHPQNNDLQLSKHAALSCTTCHEAHGGIITGQAKRPAIKRECSTCHQNIAKAVQTGSHHRGVACIACHMPRVDKSTRSDTHKYSAGMRTHLFRIDTGAIKGSAEENGSTVSIPGISLDFACKHCHRANGMASVISDQRLREFASGIHAQR